MLQFGKTITKMLGGAAAEVGQDSKCEEGNSYMYDDDGYVL